MGFNEPSEGRGASFALVLLDTAPQSRRRGLSRLTLTPLPSSPQEGLGSASAGMIERIILWVAKVDVGKKRHSTQKSVKAPKHRVFSASLG